MASWACCHVFCFQRYKHLWWDDSPTYCLIRKWMLWCNCRFTFKFLYFFFFSKKYYMQYLYVNKGKKQCWWTLYLMHCVIILALYCSNKTDHAGWTLKYTDRKPPPKDVRKPICLTSPPSSTDYWLIISNWLYYTWHFTIHQHQQDDLQTTWTVT